MFANTSSHNYVALLANNVLLDRFIHAPTQLKVKFTNTYLAEVLKSLALETSAAPYTITSISLCHQRVLCRLAASQVVTFKYLAKLTTYRLKFTSLSKAPSGDQCNRI